MKTFAKWMMRVGLPLLLLLGGCVPLSPSARNEPRPSLSLTPLKDDITTRVETVDGAVVVHITSASGIGGLAGEFSGARPATLHFRLNLTGLEQVEFAYDDVVVSSAAATGADGNRHVNLQAGAGSSEVIGPENPNWLDVMAYNADRTPATSLPLVDGYFDVTAPSASLARDTGTFSLRWVDFFR